MLHFFDCFCKWLLNQTSEWVSGITADEMALPWPIEDCVCPQTHHSIFIAHHFPHVLLLVSLFPVPFLLSHSSFSPRCFMCSSESYNFHYIFVLPSFNLRLRNISDFQ